MTNPTDTELLQRYTATGDRAALDTIVRRHIDFVYAAARRMLGGDATAADDVTQAVFIVLSRKAASVPPTRIGGWLFRTTRYATANARRLASRRAHHEAKAKAPEAVMPEHSDSATADAQELLPRLDDALASLGRTDREAVILRYLNGVDVPGVAASLGVSEAAARRRINRAIEKLRKILKAAGVSSTAAGGVVGALSLTSADKAPAGTIATITSGLTQQISTAAGVMRLSNAVVRSMFFAKAKLVIGLMLMLLFIGGAGTVVVVAVVDSRESGHLPPVIPAFAGQLPNGVTVELAGVHYTDGTSNAGTWRRADGTPMNDSERPVAIERTNINGEPASGHPPALLIRLSGPPGVTVDPIFEPLGEWASQDTNVAPGHFERRDLWEWGIRAGAPSLTARVYVATKPWEKRLSATIDGPPPVTVTTRGAGRAAVTLVFTGPTSADDPRAQAVVTGLLPDEDLIAEAFNSADKSFNMIGMSSGKTPEGARRITITFDLPANDLRRIELSTRPRDGWVEFRNVSLKQGMQTTVTVVTGVDTPSAAKPMVDRSTPRAALRAYLVASDADDNEGKAAVLIQDSDEIRRIVAAWARTSVVHLALIEAVRVRLGEAAAVSLRENQTADLDAMPDSQITVNGDQAGVALLNGEPTAPLVRSAGGWRLDLAEYSRRCDMSAAAEEKQSQVLATAYESLRKQVESGQIISIKSLQIAREQAVNQAWWAAQK